jgi:predicted PolB exonuclease-like 3'-5' exonuclease
MLDELKSGNILFLDIETVPLFPTYHEMPENLRMLWDKKASYLKHESETPAELYHRAGIYAEFGKIICISTGMFGLQEEKKVFRVKSYYDDEEKVILSGFAEMLSRISQKREIELCAHNGREFDFPYLSRRMLINGIKLPALLDTAGKRPWEIRHIDTMELWKFGDYKHYTSLDLLAAVFGISSPKSGMEGSQVAAAYWEEKDIKKIVAYCRQDVITVAMIFLKYRGEELPQPEEIVVLDD